MPKYRKIMLLLEITFYLLTTFLVLDFLILSVDSLKDDSASTSNQELIIDERTSNYI